MDHSCVKVSSNCPKEDCLERISRNEDIYSQVTPPGFLLIPSAFKNNIKAIPRKRDFVTHKDMVNAAIDLVCHQDIGYSIANGQSLICFICLL
jgi:hypothetical protein